MKATRSKDGYYRADVRVTFRVGLAIAAEAIADFLIREAYEGDVVGSVGRMGLRRPEDALRSSLSEEGQHIHFISEGHSEEGDWEPLVVAVTKRLVELGLFPPNSEAR